jgi:hypothetical protein
MDKTKKLKLIREQKCDEMTEIRRFGPFISSDPASGFDFHTFTPETEELYQKLCSEVQALTAEIGDDPSADSELFPLGGRVR